MADIFNTLTNRHRLTQKQKEANNFQWYKDYSNLLDKYSFYNDRYFGEQLGDTIPLSYKQKKVNYDLFNNIFRKEDLKYVYKPFGKDVDGELPANMGNKDIVSPKIKVLLGMEMSMPLSWKVLATDEQTSSRKEEYENQKLKDYVISEIMSPIRKRAEVEMQQQTAGRQLSAEEQSQIHQQIDDEVKANTPDQVRKYMAREHQDPAEILGTQILEYLSKEQIISDKFNKGFKHLNLGGKEVYRISIINGDPTLTVVNALFFDHDQSAELDTIEDGSWAVAEYRMTPNQILTELGSQLKPNEIDRVFDYETNRTSQTDPDFNFGGDTQYSSEFTLRVLHTTWKAPKKVVFLSYLDKDGQVQETIVDENYKFNRKAGDIEMEITWIPEAHECWKILDDIYVYCRPVPGQNKDLDNLWKCKLPYYGAAIDNMNSPITAPMERIKEYQYYYNIILYRIELLMAKDKGKKMVWDVSGIPKSAGIDLNRWLYFFEANDIAFTSTREEGNKGINKDITNMVKEIDMSLVSQIDNYIKLAEYIETKCGAAIGVTKAMEGAIGPTDAVSNTKQNLIQSSYITRPIFELHNQVKRNVLQGLIDTAKVAYSTNKKKKLSYFLDDMSLRMLDIDGDLLDASNYGVFVTSSTKSEETKQAIINLSQAALQNQQATLIDIANVIDSNSVAEAKELLTVAQQKAQEREDNIEQQKMKLQQQEMARQDRNAQREQDFALEQITTKEKERRKTELAKAAITGLSFNPEEDQDEDGVPDFLEIARDGVDAEIKRRNTAVAEAHQTLEEDKFSHQQKVDKEKLKIENKKLNKPVGKK